MIPFLAYVIGAFVGVLLAVRLNAYLQRRDRLAQKITQHEARLRARQGIDDMWKKIKK